MSKIISIHSFRGGVGKTSLLAEMGKYASQSKRVGIIDADCQSPCLYAFFSIDPSTIQKSFSDFWAGKASVADAVIEQAHCSLLLSRPRSIDLVQYLREKPNYENLAQKLDELIADLQLDLLLIDTHTGVNEENLTFLSLSDIALLLHGGEDTESHGLYSLADLSKKLGVPTTHFLVNRLDASVTLDEIMSFCSFPCSQIGNQGAFSHDIPILFRELGLS